MRCTRREGVAEDRCEEPAETSLEAGSGAGEARAGPDTAEGRGKVWAGPEVRGPATMGGAMGELNMELDEERRLRDREMETRHPIKHARYSQQLSHQETRFGSGSCDKNKTFAQQENESESELWTPCSLLGQRQSGDEPRAAKFCIIQVQVSDGVMLSAGF